MQEKRWIYDYYDVESIAAEFNLNESIAQILYKRGFRDSEEIESFLYPDFSNLHPAKLLKDIDVATQRILRAIEQEESIVIYGDYDVDGTTATAIMLKALKKNGAKRLSYYIPDRHKEGYGLNVEAVEKLAQNHDVMITVDLGITAKSEVEVAKKYGMDVIITDHHEPQKEFLPEAYAVINPKQEDCSYPFNALAGCGVAFKLAERIFQINLNNDSFSLTGEYLDLVTLGTIADQVPLIGENRILTKLTLSTMNNTKNLGLYALIDKAGLKEKQIEATHVGFMIGPRINAAGRMAHSKIVVKLLTTNSATEATQIAEELDRLNAERKSLVDQQEKKALELLEECFDEKKDRVIVLADEEFSGGLAGIVASRLVDKYYVPTILIDKKSGRGSARSIDGISIFDGLEHCSELLKGFGGHTMAAGLSIDADKLESLRDKLNKWAHKMPSEYFIPTLDIDVDLPLQGVSMDLIEQLDLLRPFGAGNPEPLFKSKELEIASARLTSSGKHMQLVFKKGTIGKKAIWWRVEDKIKNIVNKIIEEKESLEGKQEPNSISQTSQQSSQQVAEKQTYLDVVYKPSINSYRGRTNIQLIIEDVKFKAKENNYKQRESNEVDEFIRNLFEKSEIILAEEPYRGIDQAENFATKVRGVTYEERQEVLAELKNCVGEELQLIREPDNSNDENAIMVYSQYGQLGYIRREVAEWIAPLLDNGIEYRTTLVNITGGDVENGKENYGANIYLEKDNVVSMKTLINKGNRERLSKLGKEDLIVEIKNELIGESKSLFPKQKEGIYSLLNKHNVLQIMGTGRGKSLIFQIYGAYQAIKNNAVSIFFYPLRALINDQYQFLREVMAPLGINVQVASGSLTIEQKNRLFEDIKQNNVDIILATPEFIEYHLEKFKEVDLNFIVVDEAHHIDDSNRKTYCNLDKLINAIGNPQVFACTATANNDTAYRIKDTLNITLPTIVDRTVRENLEIDDQRGIKNKNAYLLNLLRSGEKTVIYVNSKKKTQELAMFLADALPNIRTTFYHSGLTPQERKSVETFFNKGEIQILVATSAFGEGVNIKDILHVVLYHMNFSLIDFTQQAGRAGRDGMKAVIHLLFNKDDAKINDFILNMKTPEKNKMRILYVVLDKLAQMKGNPLTITNKDLAKKIVSTKYVKQMTAAEVSSALGILEELGLIIRNGSTHDRTITVVERKNPSEKVQLLDSLRYVEGIKDKDVFYNFREYVLNVTTEELLTRINRPVAPDENFDAKEVEETA
ncbi:MAG: single-stranded-DNA-specific exonuclease RecJ [bacterium]